jgi:5S rRNA maturation endonuclease (ribonuclease M5)
MAAVPKIEECERVLIVEGHSDLLFYAELLESLGKHAGTYIKSFNGRSEIETKLDTFLNPQLFASKTAIAVIVDADSDASSISLKLTQALSKITGQTIAIGTWSTGTPKIGFFVTPDCQSNGEIESLVWNAWANDPKNSEPRQCIEAYINCMNTKGFKAQSPHKGLVSSLLAIHNDEDPRLGPGARTKKIFDLNRPEYSSLKSFLSAF